MVQRFERQVHHPAVDDDLSRMFEIHGDAVANDRLDLAKPPLGLAGMAHQGADLQEVVHVGASAFGRATLGDSMNDMDLVSLFCSRICHDLISPVGAVSNGLELIAEDDPALAERPEFRLASHSASRAADAIAFFRIAFGGAAGGPVEIAALAQITARHLETERLKVSGPSSRGRLSRNTARMALTLALTGASALPRGGRLSLSATPEGPRDDGGHPVESACVEAAGQPLRLSPAAKTAIEELRPPSPAQPRDAHLLALTRLARATGALLTIDCEDGRLRLTAVAPRPLAADGSSALSATE
jgi:histidine phosphotransferase ChpT